MDDYEIVFSGQIVPGANLETVKINLAKLFQADASRIESLFSGRRVVLKAGLDAASAEKYRSVIERAGAQVEVFNTQVIEEIELAPPPEEHHSTVHKPLQVVPRDEYMAAFVEVDALDFGLAPVGADLQDQKAEVAPPKVDLSQFSLAPVGSDMGQAKASPPAPPPSTNHLKLAD